MRLRSSWKTRRRALASDVPEMIEALIAGMAFAIACGCGVCYIETVSEKRG